MRGIRYMKIYEIIDEENAMSAGVLLYYEKEKTCIAELPEYLDEWTAPFLFSVYVKKHIFTIPRDISFLWVKERVIPSGRQNIDAILKNHHMKSYDEMKFLEISEGRCSQDSLYIRKIDRLPDYVVERQKHNLVECVPMDEHALLCFFADQTVRKMELAKLTGVECLCAKMCWIQRKAATCWNVRDKISHTWLTRSSWNRLRRKCGEIYTLRERY